MFRDLSLDDVDDIAPSFPLCMASLHSQLREAHHLKHEVNCFDIGHLTCSTGSVALHPVSQRHGSNCQGLDTLLVVGVPTSDDSRRD